MGDAYLVYFDQVYWSKKHPSPSAREQWHQSLVFANQIHQMIYEAVLARPEQKIVMTEVDTEVPRRSSALVMTL